KALGNITNYDVLSRGKGLITLKVYREDGSNEIIQNFKASDLHLGEWRKVKSVNTDKRKSVTSAIGKQRSNAVKSSSCWVWRPNIKVEDHVSKNSESYICKRFYYVDPEGKLKSVMAWVSKRN
nr:hypothetical protein [Tanacetum cinerariifolium]